ALAACDLNGDGYPDLAIVNANTVAILLNRGDGTFAAASFIATGPRTTSCLLGDLNGDRKLDLVTLHNGSFVVVWAGNGNGTFQPGIATNIGIIGLGKLADLNSDGRLDLAVPASPGAGVLLGNGDGTFQASYLPLHEP